MLRRLANDPHPGLNSASPGTYPRPRRAKPSCPSGTKPMIPPMDTDARWRFVADLPNRLAPAIDASDLDSATRPPDEPGVVRTTSDDWLRIGTRLVPSAIPRITLGLDPPIDARRLCQAWGIARPVAVSGDVRQSKWSVLVAGDELADPSARRISARSLTAGRWDVNIRLTARPVGDLPDVVSGASPAYDIVERGGAVSAIEVSLTSVPASVVDAGHPDVHALLSVMAAAFPVWRAGWEVEAGSTFVVLYEGDRPVAGAAIGNDQDGTVTASRVCVAPDRRGRSLGASLLEALEGMALKGGSDQLRLDSSVFLMPSDVPYARYGYVVGPPYDGDSDAPMWAIKDLADQGRRSQPDDQTTTEFAWRHLAAIKGRFLGALRVQGHRPASRRSRPERL